MCGLKARDVREELVSGAVREAEQDLVYGEIKPTSRPVLLLCSLGEQGRASTVPLQALMAM